MNSKNYNSESRGIARALRATAAKTRLGFGALLRVCSLVILLACLSVQGMWAQTGNWSDYKNDRFAGGTGTQADPYLVETAEQLAYFASSVTAGNTYAGKYVKLAADIDLGAHWWQPIGALRNNNTNLLFQGNFDGGMHVIRNMSIDWTSGTAGNDEKYGFFSVLSDNSTVKNVIFDNARIVANKPYTYSDHKNLGVLAGELNGSSGKVVNVSSIVIRDNCKIGDNGNATTSSGAASLRAGGLAGYVANGYSRVNNIVSGVDINFSKSKGSTQPLTLETSNYKNCIGGVFGYVDNGSVANFTKLSMLGKLTPSSNLEYNSGQGKWRVNTMYYGDKEGTSDTQTGTEWYEGSANDVKDKFYFIGDVKEEHLPKDYGTNIHTFTLPVINAAGESVNANTAFDWTLIGVPSEDPLASESLTQMITVYSGSAKLYEHQSLQLPSYTFTDINLKPKDVLRIHVITNILRRDGNSYDKPWSLQFYDGQGEGHAKNTFLELCSVLKTSRDDKNVLQEDNYAFKEQVGNSGVIEIPVTERIAEGLTSLTTNLGKSLAIYGVDIEITSIEVVHNVMPFSFGVSTSLWEGNQPKNAIGWPFGSAGNGKGCLDGVEFEKGDSIRIWSDYPHSWWNMSFFKQMGNDDNLPLNIKDVVDYEGPLSADNELNQITYPLAFKQGYIAIEINDEWYDALTTPSSANNQYYHPDWEDAYFTIKFDNISIKKIDVRKKADPSDAEKEVAYQIYGVDTVRIMTDLFPKKGYRLEVYKKGTTPREQVYSASFTVSPEQWGEGHIHSTSLEGAGTSANPYKIKTAADLAYMIGRENDNKYYALENDVDLDHAWWNPMGIVTPFKGTLEGNGYAIYNMNVDWTANANSGFFSQLDGKVQNLIIDNAKLSALNDVPVSTVNVGVLAGSVAKTAAASIRNIVIRRSQITDLDTIAAADNKVVHHSIRGSGTNHTNMGGLVGVVNDGQKVDMRYVASQVNFELTKGDKFHDVGGIIGRNNHAKNANFVPSYLYFEGDASKATMAINRNTIYGYGGTQPDPRSDIRHGAINALTFSGQSTQQLDHDVISASHTEASTKESLLAWHYDTPLEGGYNGFKLLEVTSKYEVDDVEGPAGHLHRKTREFMTYDFTYTRDIAPGMWVPFISPVSFTAEQMEEQGLCVARLYDINFVINADHTNTDWIYIQLLQLHGDDATEANVPYMVLRDEAATGHEYKGKLHLEDAAKGIKVGDNKPYWQQCASVEYIFTFCGSFEPFAKGALYKAPGSDKVNYVLSATDGRWHRPSVNLALKANRFYISLERKSPEWCAYFDEEDEASAPSIRMRLVGEDEFTDETITTAISEVEAADNNNIVRVSAAQIGLRPGLYVIEGKQVVVE